MKKIMIVAGEASGDNYGAGLIRSLRKKEPNIEILAQGGEEMRAAGAEILNDISGLSVVGITEVLSHIHRLRKAFKSLVSAMERQRPDLLILIDFPDFNLRLASKAKKIGIKVLYYISPQVWAWRRRRVKEIARLVDKMLVAFPFEVDIYKKEKVDCEFVGHPIVDDIERQSSEFGDFVELSRDVRSSELREAGNKVISMFPGSRKREVVTLLPVMLDSFRILTYRFSELKGIIPVAHSVDYRLLEDMVKQSGLQIILTSNPSEALSVSDAAIVASGTATLQAAYFGVPMVIVYKVSPVTYAVARLLVKIKNIGIVNILAGGEVVPELMQGNVKAEKISEIINRYLTDKELSTSIKDTLIDIGNTLRLSTGSTSDRVADISLSMIGGV